MALGKRRGIADILPRLKFDARIGKFYLENRVQENGEWQTVQSNIEPDDFCAVADLENIRVGWIDFPKGTAPDTVLVAAGEDWGDPPTSAHKLGVRLIWKMDDALGADVRELMSTAVGLWTGIDELHEVYLANAPDHPGQSPVVTVAEVEEKKTSNGTTFIPHFEISEWVSRPSDLPPPLPVAIPAAKTSPKPAARGRADMDDEIPF